MEGEGGKDRIEPIPAKSEPRGRLAPDGSHANKELQGQANNSVRSCGGSRAALLDYARFDTQPLNKQINPQRVRKDTKREFYYYNALNSS